MIVLASGSPRRRQLLEWVGLSIKVVPPSIDERRREFEAPVSYALRLAAEKAAVVVEGDVVIAADTIVHDEERVWGKPVDREDAAATLRALSGGWHQVTTAFAVRGRRGSVARAVTTSVRFRTLREAEIQAYVASGEADDKAGAYGIQGLAGAFVAELHGSWTNVMGLPVEEVLAAVSELA